MLVFRYDSEFENYILNKSGLFPEDKYSDLHKEIENAVPPNEARIASASGSLSDLWNKNKESFFSSIRIFFGITKKQLPELPEITVYLTRLPRHPYNFFNGERYWFTAPLMVPDSLLRLKVVVHELTHYFFLKLGWGKFMKEKGFSDKAIDDVKETTATILVNTSYQSFLQFVHEKGHERNKEFRDYVTKNAKDLSGIRMKEIMQLAFKFYKVG